MDACFNQAEAPDQGLAPASVPLKLRRLGFAADSSDRLVAQKIARTLWARLNTPSPAEDDKGLEQLERHLLGQAALVQLQLRTNHDDRTAGVVEALAQQVLTETPLLALERISESDLSGTIVGAACNAGVTKDWG
jgi:hypothetical protein